MFFRKKNWIIYIFLCFSEKNNNKLTFSVFILVDNYSSRNGAKEKAFFSSYTNYTNFVCGPLNIQPKKIGLNFIL